MPKFVKEDSKKSSQKVVVEGLKVKSGEKQLLKVGEKYEVSEDLANSLVKLKRAKIV